ncbi:MAG: hypothetical protein WHT28_06010 [Fimbriimonadales bacterium]|jgi:hypothetical protein
MRKVLTWVLWILAVLSLWAAVSKRYTSASQACEQPSQCTTQYYWDSPLLR